MANVLNLFVNKIMDSDTSYSLIDDKSVVRVENLRVSGDGDDGTYKNIKSSELVSDYSENGTMEVIRMYAGRNNKMYYFLAKPNGKSKIVEYDVVTRQSRLIIEDLYILRFDLIRWDKGVVIFPFKYLLSVNQIGDLLIFSNEVWKFPRVINLRRIDDYALGFTEDDISMAKKPPQKSPSIVNAYNDATITDEELKNKFISFAYRYKYKDGDYSSLSFYSDTPFLQSNFAIDDRMLNKGMKNFYNAVNLVVDSGGKNVTDVEVYAREHGSNTAYLIYNANKKKSNFNDNTFLAVNYKYSTNYVVLNEEDTKLLYNNTPMFPKTQDSAGSRMLFANYKEGFDLKDVNGEDVIVDYEVDVLNSSGNSINRKTAISLFSYKVGLVYLDEHNISTTVLLPQNENKAEVSIGFQDRLTLNTLQVKFLNTIKHPTFANKLKFVVKSQPLNYENIFFNYVKRIGKNLYFLVSDGNVNKIKLDDRIIFTGNQINTYKEFVIEELSEKNIDDGFTNVGFYAKVKDKEALLQFQPNQGTAFNYRGSNNIPMLPDDGNKNTILNGLGYIFHDSMSTVALGFTYNNYISPSYGNFANIPLYNGDSLEFEFSIQFYRNVTKSGGNGSRMLSLVVLRKETIFVDDDYDNAYELILEKIQDAKFDITGNGSYVNFILNTNMDDLINSQYPDISQLDNEQGFRIGGIGILKMNLIKGLKGGFARTVNKDSINDFYYETTKTFNITNGKITPSSVDGNKDVFDIGFYNGYCWENGVESYRIKDEFNAKRLDFNFRGSLVEPNSYKQIHRKNDVTYSGLYNYELGINRLSNFNASLANWKTLPIKFGEIQRIISTDGDITVFTENKVMSLLYGKSLILDARGNENVGLSTEVLGDTIVLPYEYGISNNPESISMSGGVIYFVDKYRARYLIKQGNQIQEINGLGSKFLKEGVENLKENQSFLGSFDDSHGDYVSSLNHDNTLLYNLDDRGFVSYATIKSEYHLGQEGKHYTAYKGKIYENYAREDNNRIAGQFVESKLVLVVNAELQSDKVYKALMLNSNMAWQTNIKTNYTETQIYSDNYVEKESFYFSEICRDVVSFKTASGIGVIEDIDGNDLDFAYSVSPDISVGENVQSETTFIGSEIITIFDKTISVADSSLFTIGDYVFSARKNDGSYSPDGEPIRGKWMEVTLTNSTSDNLEITSVSTEIIKSNL